MDTFFERVRSDGTRAGESMGDRDARAGSAAELLVRGLLVGAGVGAILVAGGRDQLVIVLFAGVLAIGAAIAELGA